MKFAQKTIITIVLVLPFVPKLTAQTYSKEQKEILVLQDNRSLGDGKLLAYLQNKDKDLRFRAAVALANLQDTSTIGALVPLLQDGNTQVRAAAAFALGQIGSASAEQALLATLTPDQDVQVLARVLEALGKCGDSGGLDAVIAYIPSARNIAIKRDQALSIARFAMRKITSERGVWLCFDLLKDNHSETRSAALYALWRSSPLGVLDVEISKRAYLLVNLMSDKDANVRINLAALLGRTKSEEAPRLLKMFLLSEKDSPDWRVQVQLARSFASLAGEDPSLIEPLTDYLSIPNDHVKIASLMALASVDQNSIASFVYKDKLRATLKTLATTPSKGAILVQGEAIVTLGRMFPEELPAIKMFLAKHVADNVLRAKYLEALSYHSTSGNVREIVGYLADDSVRVAMAAWDFLKRMIQPANLQAGRVDTTFIDSLPMILVDRMRSALARNDPAITTLVADLFADTFVAKLCNDAGYGRELANTFMSVYRQLASSRDAESMQAIQRTFAALRDPGAVALLEASLSDLNHTVAVGAANSLRKITGSEYRTSIRTTTFSARPDADWKTLESIKPGQRITFRTTKGSFTIRLRKEDAPFTVLAFYKLVEQGFYNGLSFHRVVPDFVIQGGDPRGDGWGGPGFTIRSEWSLVNFERGSVGMASSGKDTEGCQFFITHIPAPQLDGRYTLFATVTSGMEVVDRIQAGDKILKAEIR